jgi:membrane protease YdiL (CAAX protease family)
MMEKEKRVLKHFLIFTLAISALVQAGIIFSGGSVTIFGPVLMLVPMAIAVVLKLLFYRKQSLLGFRLGKPLYYLLALIIPLAYIALGYALYWLFVPGTFAGTGVLVETVLNIFHHPNLFVSMVATLIITIFGSSLFGLGEEAGWRGLMYPIMHKLWGRNKALLASGFIWAAWHIPMMVGADYNAGTPLWYGIPMFIFQVIALNVIASWLVVKSNSVFPAAVWHGTQNFLNQIVFRSMTAVENSAYFIDETGFISTLSAAMFAVLILVFGKFDKGK